MSFGQLMAFVRETWGSENAPRNGSIVRQLWRKYSEAEVEAMVRGAALLGFTDLRIINGAAGEGRRNCMSAYYRSRQRAPVGKLPQQVAAILKGMLE